MTRGLEVIRWRDSGMHLASDEWTSITELRARSVLSGMEVTTVGMLVHEDDHVVILGLSIDEEGGSVVGAQAIWKASILERRVLDQAAAWSEPGSTGSIRRASPHTRHDLVPATG
jgi:hypothetical protein